MALVLVVNLLKRNLKPDHVVSYNQVENNTAIMLSLKNNVSAHLLWIRYLCNADRLQVWRCTALLLLYIDSWQAYGWFMRQEDGVCIQSWGCIMLDREIARWPDITSESCSEESGYLLCTTTAAWTTAGALEECVIHNYVYPLAVFAEVRLSVIATDFMERVAVTICHSIASSASDAATVYRGAHSRDIKHRKTMYFRAFFTEAGQQSLKFTF